MESSQANGPRDSRSFHVDCLQIMMQTQFDSTVFMVMRILYVLFGGNCIELIIFSPSINQRTQWCLTHYSVRS